MKRDGFGKIVSQAVSRALGLEIGLTSQGRASHGRHCFARTQESECYVCCVPFLKEHVDSEYSHPYTVEERPYTPRGILVYDNGAAQAFVDA